MLIFVCDDSEADRARLLHHINTFSKETHASFDIVVFDNAEKLIESFKISSPKPQIIFLDIYMEGTNGMDAAKRLIDLGMEDGIVFTTSSETHALEAFKIGADGYLHKPYTHDDFIVAMKRFKGIIEKSRKFIVVNLNRKEIKLYLDSIIFAESLSHCTVFHTTSGEIRVANPLNAYSNLLVKDLSFTWCGRSYVMNLNFISEYNSTTGVVTFTDGTSISAPVRVRREIKEKIQQYSVQQTNG